MNFARRGSRLVGWRRVKGAGNGERNIIEAHYLQV
jgi:hypothetical protein